MTIDVAVYACCPTVRILLRRSTAGQCRLRRYDVKTGDGSGFWVRSPET